jgi:DNA gyrase subunit A
MATKDEDAVTELFVTSTHTPVLFFSNIGKVYRLKVWRLPEGGPSTKGGRWSTCCRWAKARRSRTC